MLASETRTRLAPGVHLIPGALTPERCKQMIALPVVLHHDDEGGHAAHAKTLVLPHVASELDAAIEGVDLGGFASAGVDAMMKTYRLAAPEGAVPAHCDDDFAGPGGSVALFSLIVYLDEGYEGGETVFTGGPTVGAHAVGDALLFRHDVRHEALPVTAGVKHVLKTDLFVRPARP